MSLILVLQIVTDRTSYLRESNIQPSSIEYNVNIYGKFAVCKLKQGFSVTVDNINEAYYQFPVDYNSAFCDLVVRTPREEIRGLVKEKSEAKKIYT